MPITISQNDFNQVLEAREVLLTDYGTQECVLLDYVKKHPANTDPMVVKEKIRLLNRFYATRVVAEDMLKNILLIDDFDQRLQKGDLSLVHDIASCSKDYLSFATKYCAMHNPEKFPIYDSFVFRLMEYLHSNHLFTKTPSSTIHHLKYTRKSQYYKEYVDMYHEFMDVTGISSYCKNCRQVDWYLWGIIQIYMRINTPVVLTQLKKHIPGIISGLLANAIWKILTKIF